MSEALAVDFEENEFRFANLKLRADFGAGKKADKGEFAKIPIDRSWSFSDKTQKDTNYITHSYYTYPAKFIPQLAARLIEEWSEKGSLVVDPFMGSGTTIVESLVSQRRSAGCDINEIAFLVASAKTAPLDCEALSGELAKIQAALPQNSALFGKADFADFPKAIPDNERIDFWFSEIQKEKLGILLFQILKIEEKNVQNFFLVAFAQILKGASIWLQKSVKPTRDKSKNPADAFNLFFAQARKMIKKNAEYCATLSEKVKANFADFCKIACADSRSLPLSDNSASLVVTSPPYVTSYEYADLHQLPLLWLGHLKTLPEFRQKFIGSGGRVREKIDLKSKVADGIVQNLKNKKKSEVQNYWADMLESFLEMRRVLKAGGKACIVIGNTQFDGVEILNAEVFAEQMQNIGFAAKKIIRREIPSKMLPSTRDAATGRFAKTAKTDSLAYPTEYILVMEKV